MWIEDTRDILRRFRLFLCLVLVIGCTVRAGISQEMGCQTFKKSGTEYSEGKKYTESEN